MRSAWVIARQQTLRQLGSGAVCSAIIAMALVSVLAAAMGVRQYVVRTDRQEQLLRQLVEDQIRRPGTVQGWQVEPALRVLRPPSPSSVLVRGLDGLAPAYWDFGPAGSMPSGVQMLEEVDADLGPLLDLEFINRVLLGLFAFVLAMESVRIVQRTGDLQGLSGLPLSALQLWTGQLLGAAAVVLVAWSVVALVALATVHIADPNLAESVDRTLFRITPATIAYLGFCLSAGALLATIGRKARTVYFATLCVWLLMGVLLPPALVGMARLLRPVSPFLVMSGLRNTAFAGEVRAGENALGDALVAYRTANPSAIKRDVDPGFIASGEVNRIWMPFAVRARQAAQAVNDDWERDRHRQERLLTTMEWVSPASLFWRAATNASGVGHLELDAWQSAIQAHEGLLRTAVFDDRARVNLRPVTEQAREVLFVDRHSPRRLSELPQFDSASVRPFVGSDMSLLVIALLGYAIVIGAFAFHRFARVT